MIPTNKFPDKKKTNTLPEYSIKLFTVKIITAKNCCHNRQSNLCNDTHSIHYCLLIFDAHFVTVGAAHEWLDERLRFKQAFRGKCKFRLSLAAYFKGSFGRRRHRRRQLINL